MPRVALTAEEIDAFRARAVAVATRLFGEEGYEAVTMRSLAKELDCSPMTPYRYFSNKEELFASVRAAAFRRFADRQAETFAKCEDPRQRLLLLGRAYVQFALDEPDAYRIMFELRQELKSPHPDLEAEQKRAFSYIHEAVAGAGLDGDPLTVAHLLWAQVHGIVSLHLASKLIMGRRIEELCEAALTLPRRES